jgi:tRNA threonylcarbamoyladenosine biosynthesis protein TsaB
MPKPEKFQKFLAFDTSTDRVSIALTDGAQLWQHSGPGGAQASSTLIPAILALLDQAGLTLDALDALDAIVFGRGPGSFTGLRTACAVAQGLAFGARQGAGLPVLPVDTLMALAEEARFQQAALAPHTRDTPGSAPLTITALLDARMDEMYVQSYEFHSGLCTSIMGCELIRPENLVLEPATGLFAGNVFGVYAGRLPAALAARPCIEAYPSAAALLRLAPALAAAGHCVAAELALPLYVRDKVAFTTEERALAKADALLAAEAAQVAGHANPG